MARTVVDMTGYECRWDFEASVAQILWSLGGPGIRTGLEGTVLRSKEKGRQSMDQSIRSALLGGAIAIQSAVFRQRANARVQATGSSITKMLQAKTWEMYRVPSLCIHDELVFPLHSNWEYAKIQVLVDEFTAEWKRQIPSLFFDMKECAHWSDK